MGGHAYLISGTLDPQLWQNAQQSTSPPPPRSLWRRIAGMAWNDAPPNLPHVTTLPNGDRLLELAADSLPDRLIPDLLGWIKIHLTPPSQASASALEYLSNIKPTLYVRGLQRTDKANPEFWIQVTFSGCAGQAETSAHLASHWTALWYGAEHERITREHLIPFGFRPHAYDTAQDEPMLFLPVGDLGYAKYMPPDQPSSQPTLELDQAVIESRPNDPAIERLNESVVVYMTDCRCRCQLCDPGFGDTKTT
jgi:hypothetical protein